MNIFEFEEKYKIVLEKIEEWNYLRVKVAFELKNKENVTYIKKQKTPFLQKIYNKINKIKQMFYKFYNWFGKYEYIFFSDSMERKILNNVYFDKFSDRIIEKLDKATLLIETPNPKHYKNTYTKNIVSMSLIDFFTFIVTIFKNYDGCQNLEDILKDYDIKLDIKKAIRYYNASYTIYSILLKVYRPKIVFVNCYYCKEGLITAAHDLNIKVVEIQHGVISKMHFGYVSKIDLNEKYFPDTLLSFGEKEKVLSNLLIKNIIPIGSFYIEHIRNTFKQDKNLVKKINNYYISIGISMQDQEWERKLIFDFIRSCANLNPNILFIIIPRKRKDFPVFSPNVLVETSLDCYNIILHCNIHMTLYSSCSLEAPSLGIPNILINSKHFAKDYYEQILDTYHTLYIEEMSEFTKAVKELLLLDSKEIINKNRSVFYPEYEKNILKFIRRLL